MRPAVWFGEPDDRHGRAASAWRLGSGAALLAMAGGFFLVLWTAAAAGQTTFGTISGTVVDESGAVIEQARITVLNEETAAQRSTTTDAGVYFVPDLEPGVYAVRIQKNGFRIYERTGLHLSANQVITVDAQLGVGSFAETIEVAATSGASPNGETPTLNNVIPSAPLVELPTITRQKGDQGLWGYGSYNNGISHEPFFIANGSRYVDTQPTVDGITAMSFETGIGGSTVTTGIEATSEINVQLAGAPAEFSRPVQMIMVSKSGGNEFHGSVFEDYNGSSLNARDYFATAVPFRVYNDFGASLGGPLRKDRTFFFADYEGSRESTEVVNTMTVPLAAWRNGDFSGLGKTLVNPYNGQAFSGNKIPAGMISAVSQKVEALYFPSPNYGPPTQQAGNYRTLLRPGINGVTIFDKFDTRIDHIVRPSDLLFGRFSFSRMPLNAFVKNAVPPLGRRRSLREANSAVVSWTHIFTPTLLNELRAGFTRDRNRVQSGAVGSDVLNQVGLQGVGISGLPVYPIFSISGLTAAAQVPSFLGAGTNLEVTENVTYVHSAHSLKFGFDVIRDRSAGFSYTGDVYGKYIFNGAFTGSPFADFLLGLPITVSNSFPNPENHLSGAWWSAYAQDLFKVTRQLTLSYGLRWEAQLPYHDDLGVVANFDRQTGAWVIPARAVKYISPAFPANIPIETASQAGYPAESLLESRHAYFYPRFGLAYRPWAKRSSVIRGGYGIYANTIYGSLGGTLETGPYSGSQYRTNSFANGVPAFSFPNPYLAAGVTTPVNTASGVDPHLRIPYLQQWNLTLEEELGKFGFSVSYVGSHAVNLLYFMNINQPHASTTPYSPSELRYPLYNQVTWARNGGTEKYNALQVAVRRTYGRSLFLNAGYTWAKDLTDAQDQTGAVGVQPQDSYNLSAEYGPNSFVRPQRFFANVVYTLPLGKGERFFRDVSKSADVVLGGWKMAWNLMAEAGLYYTPTFDSTDPSNTNNFGGRPDRIGNAFVIPGCPVSDPRCSNPANVGRFGNCGVNVLEGPTFIDADFSLMKNFHLTERVGLQFRTTMTNVFNHPNFGIPAADIESPGTFGKVTSTVSPLLGQNARQVDLMLRVNF